MDKRFDDYEIAFASNQESELLSETIEMEKNTSWVSKVTNKDIKLEAISEPLFAAAENTVANYQLDPDLFDETRGNTGLMINAGGRWELLRKTARPTLCSTADLNGSALGRMCPALFADTINNGLHVAKGDSLILMRYGKVSAIHSNADGGYSIMPTCELLAETKAMIDKRFGGGDFYKGYNSHSYTTAIWMLPSAQTKLLEQYEDALGAQGSKFQINFIPALRFATSDTASCAATLEPIWYIPRSRAFLSFVEGIKVKHTQRGLPKGKTPMDVYKEEIQNVYAKFTESAQVIAELSKITINHGCNCVVSLCNKYGIPKKYGEAARDAVEHITVGNSTCTAHDLYLCMGEVLSAAEDYHASKLATNKLEEALAKIPNCDWAEHDVGGTVSW